MAPRIVDDFVLTLSDDDDVVPDDELEESEVDTVTELSNSHKRKRAEMKQSAVKKHKPDKEGGDEGILSDFEFDDGRAADLADFDGWETTGAGKDSISDIVDRRKGIRQHVVSDAALLTDDGSVEASEEDDLESEAEDEDENE
ncbi:hypothetical protein LTR48_009136, partial [Friedmanniomyces endolithicus]